MDKTSIHHKLYRRAIRRCCEHEIVSDLSNPDLPLLSVFTSKKYRMPWQRTRLVRAHTTLAEVMDSSVGSEVARRLSQLADMPEKTMLDEFSEHFEVDDKGDLKATGEQYARIKLDAEEKYTVDVDLGKVSYKEVDASKFAEALAGLKVQQNHYVLKERKPHSLYVVVRCDLAEKVIMTSSVKSGGSGEAGVNVRGDVGAAVGLSVQGQSQTHLTRNFQSTIGFRCARLRINGDNTLSLLQYACGRQHGDEDETDSGPPAAVDVTDGGAPGFKALLQPFDIIQQNRDAQGVILSWVKSCPSEDTVCFIEELLDNIITTGETAKSCQLPASWVCKSFVPECLTESTIALLKCSGIGVVQPAYQEAELQWNSLSDDQLDLLSACLRVVSLTDDLSSHQQAAIGYVNAGDANDVIDLVLAAAAVQVPKMDLADKNRSSWVTFQHPSIQRLSQTPTTGTLQSFGIHLAVRSETSGIFDSFLLDEGRLQNIAALVHMLCVPAAQS